MPSKIQADENLVFLYRCLVHSDCKTIDFNKVGLATNLNAPAARMRYSRLKKIIEDKLDRGSKKAPASSSGFTAASKANTGIGPNKKRKSPYGVEGEQADGFSFDDNIGSAKTSVTLEESPVGPRTRGKKIDLKEAFESDSDSSSGPGLGDQDDASDDDYQMEDISEDEEEFHPDEATEDEDDQPISRSKSKGQSTKRKTIIAKTTVTVFKSSSKSIPRSAHHMYVGETVSEPGMPTTPEPAVSSRNGTKGKSLTLPPTPNSMPAGRIKQEPADSTQTIPEAYPDATQLSPVLKRKQTGHTSTKLGLFDRIENARIQADHNLASLSYEANKNPRSSGPGLRITSETILPSIEHDAEEGHVDVAMVDISSRDATKYSAYAGNNGEGDCIFEEQESTATGRRSRSSAPLSLMAAQTDASGIPLLLSSQTAATMVAPATAPATSNTHPESATSDLCTLQ